MTYYIYNPESSKIASNPARGKSYLQAEYATEGAAKAALTRMLKKAENNPNFDSKYDWDVERAERDLNYVKKLKIAESRLYHDCIEQFEITYSMYDKERKNPIRQSVNTPAYMDPGCESYWSM